MVASGLRGRGQLVQPARVITGPLGQRVEGGLDHLSGPAMLAPGAELRADDPGQVAGGGGVAAADQVLTGLEQIADVVLPVLRPGCGPPLPVPCGAQVRLRDLVTPAGLREQPVQLGGHRRRNDDGGTCRESLAGITRAMLSWRRDDHEPRIAAGGDQLVQVSRRLIGRSRPSGTSFAGGRPVVRAYLEQHGVAVGGRLVNRQAGQQQSGPAVQGRGQRLGRR